MAYRDVGWTHGSEPLSVYPLGRHSGLNRAPFRVKRDMA
jgi:hypothetical protein